MDFSVVVPVFNEEDTVSRLAHEVTEVLNSTACSFELIFVDDGSRDQTLNRLRALAHQDRRIKVVKLTRNFGQTAALKAGLEFSSGEVIVTMDGDLQNDPKDIPALLREMDRGFDMVAGWRMNRQDAWASRKIPSYIANWIIRKAAGTSLKDNGCALRAYRASVIKPYPLYSEMHRLLPTIMALNGFRISEVPVSHHARRFGESKYGLSRTYKVILDLIALKSILEFHRSPLFGFGVISAFIGIVGFILMTAGFWFFVLTPEYTSLVVPSIGVVLSSLCVFLLSVGILCELIYATGDVDIKG